MVIKAFTTEAQGGNTGSNLLLIVRRSPTGNERPRLDDVNLALHVGPFDVLISAAAKHALDRARGVHQAFGSHRQSKQLARR